MARLGLVLAAALAPAASAAFVSLPTGPRELKQYTRQQQAHGVEVGSHIDVLSLEDQATAPAADEAVPTFKWLAAGLVAGVLMAFYTLPAEAYDARLKFTPEQFTIKAATHLELCKDNKKYKKRSKDMLFKLTKRQGKYPKGSVVYNRYEVQVVDTKKRIEAYGGRYCDKKDGLPRVIASGENVRGGIVIPSLMFLYTAGWIGWAGRSYLLRTQDKEKEINIDVPLALTCMASGFSWPVQAWQAIVNGEMAAKDKDFYQAGLAAEYY